MNNSNGWRQPERVKKMKTIRKDSTSTTSTATMGGRIRFLREKNGYTQEGLGSEIGSDKSTISGWEKDARCPSLVMIECLAQVFGVSPAYIAFGPEKDPPAEMLDLSHLTYYQRNLVKNLVTELGGC
jgi:transcriptional regulator with XRE-family HTH domain